MSGQFQFMRGHGAASVSPEERFFEILPAATSWVIIFGMLALALFQPVLAALLIIAFVYSWLIRMLYANILLGISFVRLRAEAATDWMERLRRMGEGGEPRGRTFLQRVSQAGHQRRMEELRASGSPAPSWEEVRHVVIIPVARERRAVFEPGVASIAGGRFPGTKILVILAVEERAGAEVKAEAAAVRRKYRDALLDILVVVHPDGVPGEARVKGANATHAAKTAAAWLARRGIGFGNVVVSCFDADTVVSPDYFSCLTYHFLAFPERTRASFQPIPVYQNNFWEAPGFARILDVGSSFSQLTQSTDPEALVTFSSHSMSFKALVEIGYWPIDMISDDSAIYWKAYIHYAGRYTVVPMLVTVSMDLAQDETWWKTVVNTYKQRRRWAWGVESFPIVMSDFLRDRRIPAGSRFRQAARLLHTHVSWATWPFLLTVMSWLPALFIAMGHSHSVVRYSEPRVLSTIFNLAIVGFVLSALLSQVFLPRVKGRLRLLMRIRHALEWLLVPPISLVFGAIPAMDAQVRLMLGRRMGFWVTRKSRKGRATS